MNKRFEYKKYDYDKVLNNVRLNLPFGCFIERVYIDNGVAIIEMSDGNKVEIKISDLVVEPTKAKIIVDRV